MDHVEAGPDESMELPLSQIHEDSTLEASRREVSWTQPFLCRRKCGGAMFCCVCPFW